MSATNPYDDQGDFLSEEELARRRALAGGAPGVGQPAPGVAPVQAEPVAALKPPPAIAMPSSTGAPAVSTGVISPSQLNEDRKEQQRLQTTGSGVHQFAENHHIIGPVLQALDIAGSILAPRLAVNIPGTTQHHEGLLAQNRRNIGNDIEQQGQEATAAHVQQETEDLKNPQPGVKTDDQQVLHDLMTGENGQPRINPDTQKPYTYLEAFEQVKSAGQKPPSSAEETKTITTDKGVQQWDPATKRYDIPVGGSPKAEKPDSIDQQYQEAIESGDHAKAERLLKVKADLARAGQAPQREPAGGVGTWALEEDENGNPIMFNSKTGETKAAPGNMSKPGTHEKRFGGARDAAQYADAYMAGGNFTGPGDEALMEKFFELAKPSSGFKMTQPQMDMLNHATDIKQSWIARGKHLLTPNAPYFDDTQRQNIVKTMHDLAAAKQHSGGQAPAQATPAATHIYDPATGTVKPVNAR